MSESAEVDRSPKPYIITFLEVEPEKYIYTPKLYNRTTGKIVVERRNPEERDAIGVLGSAIMPMQDVHHGVRWLSEQQPEDTARAAELARTAINLAKISTYALDHGHGS